MESTNTRQIYTQCEDCDGECIGTTICGGDGYAVCRACKKTGCLIPIEEYENPTEECRARREEARQMLKKIEEILFGPRRIKPTKLSNETTRYRICLWVYKSLRPELVDADVPYKLEIESVEYAILEVNTSDVLKVDEMLVKYD